MKIIATVTDPEAVRRILTCFGLPARPPPVAPAKEREQAELGFESASGGSGLRGLFARHLSRTCGR